jgi:transposase InsO family protein
MMLHQDASRHAWLGAGPSLDLVVTMDDATSAIYSALLVEEEGTASMFRALLEVFGRHGLPLSLYTDRGSHYFHTAEAGGKVDRDQPTQVGRALSHLGVEHIAAYSPQARGRSERLFQTLQDRLPKELALAGITTMDAANAWLVILIYRRTTRGSR